MAPDAAQAECYRELARRVDGEHPVDDPHPY